MAKTARIEDLHPGQMTLGLFYVRQSADEFKAMKRRALDALIEKDKVPVVQAPDGELWIIDRHHFCRALLEIGRAKVNIAVTHDASRLPREEFHGWLEKMRLVHPYDAEGQRRPAGDVPASLAALVDDPHRTLAGMLREAGGFKKEKAPFVEFIWADFLRRRVPAALVADLSDGKALKLASKLAKSKKRAGHLPGWGERPK